MFFNNSDKEDTYLLTVPQKGLDKNGGTSSKDFTGHINTLPSATLQAVVVECSGQFCGSSLTLR